jgi:DNA-binding transcriptional LysR family regulator
LARLRDLQGDPLLVRGGRGYVLTPRAQALQPLLAAAVRDLRRLFEHDAFDPATERRTVRLAASDVQTVLLVPGIMARLAREAPGVRLVVEPYRPDVAVRVADGTVDFAFALASTPLPPGTASEVVAEDRLALVMRGSHPAAGRHWTIADYGLYGHVGVALLGDGQSDVDAELAAAGVARRIDVVTPHFMAALATVAATDLVTTISAGLALCFADHFGLVLQDPPLAETVLQVTLVCSHVRATDRFLVWFRSMVREVADAIRLDATAR